MPKLMMMRSIKTFALTILVILSLGAVSASAATPSVRVAADYACALAEAGNVEDVAADAAGNVYAGLAGPWTLQKLERP